MASAEHEQKHRHDVGNPDHGAETTLETTQTLQGILSLCIVATIVLLFVSMFVGR